MSILLHSITIYNRLSSFSKLNLSYYPKRTINISIRTMFDGKNPIGHAPKILDALAKAEASNVTSTSSRSVNKTNLSQQEKGQMEKKCSKILPDNYPSIKNTIFTEKTPLFIIRLIPGDTVQTKMPEQKHYNIAIDNIINYKSYGYLTSSEGNTDNSQKNNTKIHDVKMDSSFVPRRYSFSVTDNYGNMIKEFSIINQDNYGFSESSETSGGQFMRLSKEILIIEKTDCTVDDNGTIFINNPSVRKNIMDLLNKNPLMKEKPYIKGGFSKEELAEKKSQDALHKQIKTHDVLVARKLQKMREQGCSKEELLQEKERSRLQHNSLESQNDNE